MRRILTTLTLFLGLVVFSFGQRTISGKITDGKSNALIGASITETGTNNGTITDENGMFSLDVSNDAKSIDVSYIGYNDRTIGLGVSNTVDVEMNEGVVLNETVVTALGIRRNRNELPYSATTVNSEALTMTRDNNVVNSLAGKVAGLEIKRNNSLGGSTNIVLRGNKSLTGSSQPLFVIDGVPYDNSNTNSTDQQTGRAGYDYGNAAADINPDDIASMTVLKGAAASALYGSRATNGVIMITTKSGRKKGLGITVNTGFNTGSIDKSTFASYQNKYGAGYGQYYEDDSGFFLLRDIDGGGTDDDLVVPFTEDASYGAAFDPAISVYHWDAFDPSSPNYLKKKPWVAAANGPESFFTKPLGTNNSIFFDGGNEMANFKLGYTFTNDKGILPNSKLTKHLINFKSGFKLTEQLTAEGSINFSKVNGTGRYGTGYDSKNLMTNFRQWWQTNVDIKDQEAAYNRTLKNVTWNWSDPTDLKPIYWDNPYWTRFENYSTDERSRYFGYASLNYAFSEHFSVLGRMGLDSYDELQEERINVSSIDPSEYTRKNRSFREYNYDVIGSYNTKFGAIKLSSNLGMNIQKRIISSIEIGTNGGLISPRFFSLNNSKDPLNPPTEVYAPSQINGVFASVMLGYKDWLNLDLTGRRDQSSTLPKGANTYFYPSASLGIKFSQFIKNFDFLTFGKLRVNYGEVGNTAPVFSTTDYFDALAPINGVPLASVNGSKANQDLKPERTKSKEIGLELAFWKNRLTFDITAYQTNTINQIIPVTISRATGYDRKFINAGDIRNRGIEIALGITPVKSKNFSYELLLNWSKNRNTVLDLGGVDNLQLATMQGGVTVNAALNEAFGTIKGNTYTYKDGQRIIGANGLPVLSATADNIIGNYQADWLGSIRNNFKLYNNTTVSFLIDIKQGGDLFSLDLYYGLATGLYPETAGTNENGLPVRSAVGTDGKGGYLFTGVLADGTPNTKRVSGVNFGNYGYRRNPASSFIYDASYVKLREVAISYDFPSSFVSKSKIFKGATLSAFGRNLWIIHKNLPYADPEDGMSSGNVQGYQVGSYPTARVFGFNLKLAL